MSGDTEAFGSGGFFCSDGGEFLTTFEDDERNVHHRLHVVDDRGHVEEAVLCGERWFVARFAAFALEGVHQRSLFATYICTCTAPQFEMELHAIPEYVVAQKAAQFALLYGMLKPAFRQRVLAPDVDVAFFAARCERRDRHRFDERERVTFHEHAVFECARL